MPPLFQSIRGKVGEVTIPALGAHIGTIVDWSLMRREPSASPVGGPWVFRAAFSYLNPHLFNDEDLPKQILVRVGPNQYRLKGPFGRTDLGELSLLIEGVDLEHVDTEPD
jgi:hypothetical protein